MAAWLAAALDALLYPFIVRKIGVAGHRELAMGTVASDLSPSGPEGLFTMDQIEELVGILDGVRATATAA